MAPFTSHLNYWYGKDASSKITVQCLLPNGLVISFPHIPADTALVRIKVGLHLQTLAIYYGEPATQLSMDSSYHISFFVSLSLDNN